MEQQIFINEIQTSFVLRQPKSTKPTNIYLVCRIQEEMRHRFGYSWGKISVTLGVPDSTARNWYHKAVLCLGEALEDVPMADELVGRASRARTT